MSGLTISLKATLTLMVPILLSLILTGCLSTEAKQTKRVVAAATIIGQTNAKREVPELPPECREHMGRVYPKLTEKWRSTQLRWEFSADHVDDRIDRCAQFHDEWAKAR